MLRMLSYLLWQLNAPPLKRNQVKMKRKGRGPTQLLLDVTVWTDTSNMLGKEQRYEISQKNGKKAFKAYFH
jgi:hypothetical protein